MKKIKGEKKDGVTRTEESGGFQFGFIGYLAVLGVIFLLLLETYAVVTARRLDYEINRTINVQSQVQREIAVLETKIAEKEEITGLIKRMEEHNLELKPCPIPVIPVLDKRTAEEKVAAMKIERTE